MVYSRRTQCIKSKLLMRNNFSLFINNRNEYCLKSTKLEASNKTDIDVALFLDATETSSVAKGLFCDRVDKSMLIYPGFEETEDLTDVEKFAGRVRSILKKQCICWTSISMQFASIYYFDLVSFVEWDKNRSETPEEVKFSFKKIGLYSMSVPQQYGGLNLNNKAKSRICAELGCDLTLFASAFVQNELICEMLKMFGSEEQKRTYLPMLAAGDVSGAFCLHEHACGQDIASMRTESVENCHGAGFKLNGQKSWVTNGALADLSNISCRLEEDRGIECDKKTKYDWDNLIIPETAILGNESAGFHIAHSMVGNSRYSFSAVAQMLHHSIETNASRMVDHCPNRISFGNVWSI
ncbi:Very long-chain specific acyl-CoA dehydrogenase, mitochondrial [Trichinella britovi]|uniref:Very long-chain specific acyl-CoA dehydrogenase, mitochondrial n=1 Tax=Trichinella britovi TaxID=45882 RepID=A0A0V1DFH0_TRIBR|nr:Very long-chain specific acyl-CoA dehydrogenase, mitochondrial [Trichinella britovi]KRY60242.1 Very long-chain specific acyl-CoA dehydrogenase, mitochondrial [Trichinella britovi]